MESEDSNLLPGPSQEDPPSPHTAPHPLHGPAIRGPGRGRRPTPLQIPGQNVNLQSSMRRRPQLDRITESSSDQQDSVTNEEDLLQVFTNVIVSRCVVC